jgi:hypothetical protein
LLPLGGAASLHGHRGEHGERHLRTVTAHGREVRTIGLERGALEARESATQLLVCAAIGSAAHGAQKGVQRERDRAIGGRTGFLPTVQDLHVHILIEGAGEPIAGGRDDAPAPAVVGGKGDGRVVG